MRILIAGPARTILFSYDRNEVTREEIANRYRVSLGMVKKLKAQPEICLPSRPSSVAVPNAK